MPQPSLVNSNRSSYRGRYDPQSPNPYQISRSKIELFWDCPRCFYLDRRLGIERPPGFPFNLNRAVDTLLKKEFDAHRARGQAHPLMKAYKIDAIPYASEQLDNWRDTFVGVQHLHLPTNFLIFGAVDDIWQSPNGELIVVDYKATSKNSEVNIDAQWQDSYKRQMEVYQWLLRRNGLPVSDTGYFVYANGRTDKKAFDAKLEFDIKVIPYQGNDNWMEQSLADIHACLNSSTAPKPSAACEYCQYIRQRQIAKT